VGDKALLTDTQGLYRLDGTLPIKVRAAGYARETVAPDESASPHTVKLTPLLPKALYLTVYGIGAPFLLDPALEVIQKSKLNALVIDVKGDRGLIPYPSALPLAAKAGALKLRTIPDLKELVSTLKAKNLYLIARIVVFMTTCWSTSIPNGLFATRAAASGRIARGSPGSIPTARKPGTTRSESPRRLPPPGSTKSSSTMCASPMPRRGWSFRSHRPRTGA
jgi:hypothetical protein